MLDPTRRVAIAEYPQVQVYRAHDQPRTYYVVPWVAAISVDDNGRPDCRLIVYGKREEGRFVATGANLTLETILAAPSGDLAQIKRSIEESLTPKSARTAEPPPPPVIIQLVSPEWVNGTVTVTLTPELKMSGQPSLFADNRCALMASLTAEGAKALGEEWPHGLPDARIVYEMTMRVAVAAAVSARMREDFATVGANEATGTARAMDIDMRGTSAQTQAITVEGPFAVEGLERLMTEIDLSR